MGLFDTAAMAVLITGQLCFSGVLSDNWPRKGEGCSSINCYVAHNFMLG